MRDEQIVWGKGQTMSDSDRWFKHWRVGRVQLGWRVYCHHYPSSSDRWVFHPYLVYDRKRPPTSVGEGTDDE